MDKKRQYKIALVLSTNGLDYDDRIRKEMLSIMELFPNFTFKIFAIIDGKNEHSEGVTSYGVPFETLHLLSRDKYPSASHLLVKAWDFYKNMRHRITNFDLVWVADCRPIFLLLLCKKPLIWDLHEIPTLFIGNKIKRMVFNYAEKRCKAILHANEERIDYLESLGMCKHREKHFALRNFPSTAEKIEYEDEGYNKFVEWLHGRECVYLQGLSWESRADYESVSAVLKNPNISGVVVGKFSTTTREKLEKEFGDELYDRIYFTGMVKQMLTPQYINNCSMSLIFYKNVSPNNWLCEPNRLFQNIINGNPVIVGNNPTMKNVVEEYGFGIVINSDGSNVEEISTAIQTLRNNYSFYYENIIRNKHVLSWESQNELIGRIGNIMAKAIQH